MAILDYFKTILSGKNAAVYVLAYTWSLFAMGYTIAITFYPITQSGVRFADVSQGFLMGTIVATIINFFFGSSKGSSDKTELLKEKTTINP